MGATIVYGGTFDPIHYGHLITCVRARELLQADRVLIMPAGVSPHKTGRDAGSLANDRAAMVKLAIAGVDGLAFEGRELERAGPSYTVETLESLERDFPGERFTLLMGADQLMKFHSWYRVADLLKREVAVLGRPGSGDLEAGLSEVEKHLGRDVAERLRRAVLRTPLVEISATEIRARVAAGLPVDFLAPPAVVQYIREKQLYR